MLSSNTKEIILERSKLKIKKMLSDYDYMYLAHYANVDMYEDLDHTVISLTTEVLTYVQSSETELTRTVRNTITRPRFANPWEHFKARYAGRLWLRWYVKRNPVKFIEEHYNVAFNIAIDLTQLLTFPEATYIYPPEIGRPVVLVRCNSQRVTWDGAVDNPLTDSW